jgi:hypothetical protein
MEYDPHVGHNPKSPETNIHDQLKIFFGHGTNKCIQMLLR